MTDDCSSEGRLVVQGCTPNTIHIARLHYELPPARIHRHAMSCYVSPYAHTRQLAAHDRLAQCRYKSVQLHIMHCSSQEGEKHFVGNLYMNAFAACAVVIRSVPLANKRFPSAFRHPRRITFSRASFTV